jgi:hypothetical protein
MLHITMESEVKAKQATKCQYEVVLLYSYTDTTHESAVVSICKQA